MALPQLSESSEEEEEEYHSLSAHDSDDADDDLDDDAASAMEPPVHPVRSLQGAFEESIRESTQEDEPSPSVSSNAEARRQQLLEAHQYDDSWTTRWRQRPSARHHPLLKLMAQIVFGMHLLQQGQAKSNEEVVRILQTHVNEVDTFLERTAEDFGLALTDIAERIRHLRLPMQHLEVFNAMLDDKKFRTQLLDGNDKIEKIIDRTAKAMNAALMDVRKGLQATQELGKYLNSIKDRWPRANSGIAEVLGAMRGNEQGWMRYLQELQRKGDNLGTSLVQLGTVIGEMSRLAAAASRRSAQQSSRAQSASRSTRSMPVSPGLRSKFARDDDVNAAVVPVPVPAIALALALNKPLPREPDAGSGAARLTTGPTPHPVPFAQRYEQPRQSPQSPPPPNTRRASAMPNGSPARPRTAGAPRDARMSSGGTNDLAEFLRQSGRSRRGSPPAELPTHINPLRSHPPEGVAAAGAKTGGRPVRARSQGANELMNGAVAGEAAPARAKSHGAAVILTSQGNNASRPGSRGADAAGRKDSVASTGFARRISHRLKHIPPPIDASRGYRPELTPIAPSPGPTPTPTTTPAPAPAPVPPTNPASIPRKPLLEDRRGENPWKAPPTHPPPLPPTAAGIDADATPQRPPSRLGLFPRADEPLTPSAASMRGGIGSSRGRGGAQGTPASRGGEVEGGRNAGSVQSTSASKLGMGNGSGSPAGSPAGSRPTTATATATAKGGSGSGSGGGSGRSLSLRNLFHRRQKSRVLA
ncbi:hypothetical protein LTR53_009315 [Teratosphaeriaceae sp. CCFEE 6253]|nr:hypothetical protein LTR53_009315 [Teratosphaeriaceae sp. CCFEE 6253]